MERSSLEAPLAAVAVVLLGSIPTAVIVAQRVAGVAIRTLRDGNRSARNDFADARTRPAIAMALVDFFKGTLAVLLAQRADHGSNTFHPLGPMPV